MANEKERNTEEQKMIPVLTVLKNGAILKNIFVVNNPPPQACSRSEAVATDEISSSIGGESDEILIVGRHPECHIVLTHPSISRFHLQIHSNPSSHKFSVVDLSSVHGTWISGIRIDPGVRVELREGDTIRVGGSTRVYRLHWVPLHRAYDLENPFMSPQDVSMTEEEEEEEKGANTVVEGGKEAVMFHDEKSLPLRNKDVAGSNVLIVKGAEDDNCQNQNSSLKDSLMVEGAVQTFQGRSATYEDIQSLDMTLEGLEQVFSVEDSESHMKKVIPSAPLLAKSMKCDAFSGQEDSESQLQNDLEGLELVFSVEDSESHVKKVIPSAPLLAKSMKCAFSGQEDGESRLQNDIEVRSIMSTGFGTSGAHLVNFNSSAPVEQVNCESENQVAPVEQVNCESENQVVDKDNQFLQYHSVAEVLSAKESMDKSIIETESKISMSNSESSLSVKEVESHQVDEIPEAMKELGVLREDFALPVEEVLSDTKTESNKENQNSQSLSLLKLLLERGNQESSTAAQKLNLVIGISSSDAEENDCNLATERLEEAGNQSTSAELGGRKFESPCYVNPATDPVNFDFSVGETLSEIADNKESEAPQTPVAAELSEVENTECSGGAEKKTSSRSIWSRRGKLASVEIQTSRNEKQIIDAGIDNEVELQNVDVESRTTPEAHLFSLEGIEAENFTPEKENFSPNTLLLKPLNKNGNLEEIKVSKLSKSISSSKVAISPSIQHEKNDMITFSDKENQTPKLQHQKSAKCTSKIQGKKMTAMKRKVERVPFQPLTAGKSRPESLVSTVASARGIQTFEKKNSAGEGKRRWTMVADTTSLLEKAARKSLQLLQGLKGTQLIVPRMVIRELDCLKRCSIFRRTEASSVLEWIEECMVKTKWWIHVQSSLEEGWPVAPTPPASPRPQFSEGSGGFSCGTTSPVPFSIHGSLMEKVSPTAEDHILDCALQFRKMNSDGKLVLLSSDITLKIKAMAEGLICETTQEFRTSLVNPFSERFLWSDSSPRGHTWSVLDDEVLKERYCRYPFKKSSKGEGAKGLKLILLHHNSHYGQISSLSPTI